MTVICHFLSILSWLKTGVPFREQKICFMFCIENHPFFWGLRISSVQPEALGGSSQDLFSGSQPWLVVVL